MREIKFRTYVINENKMIYGKRALAVKRFTDDYAYLDNEVEVMQFTGLYDKNDKEIYEGDILEVTVETTEGFYRTDKCEVIINDFTQVFVIDSEIGQDELYKHNNHSVVVGNIYEQPETNMV